VPGGFCVHPHGRRVEYSGDAALIGFVDVGASALCGEFISDDEMTYRRP
jgi:hypothetical protein